MRITKIMTFDAAHQLPNESCYGKCSNMHGHTYKLEVTVEGEITNKGWVMNFKDLKEIMNKHISKYDHSVLNEFFDIPTAELMAEYIYQMIEADLVLKPQIQIVSVRLWETSTSYVEAP